MSDDPTNDTTVTTTIDGDVAVVRIDDGKANALSHEVLDALAAAIDRAESEAKAVVVVGREGRFSAGFHLPTMLAGMDSALPLLHKGADVAIRTYLARIPVVLAVTGHALAMGAILLMASDRRIGADGPYKIGMNEVSIGMPVPRFAAELAESRLARRHLTSAIGLATLYDPPGAVEAGFLDRVVPADEVEAAAVAEASALAEHLQPTAFTVTRDIMRADLAASFRAAIARDLDEFSIHL